MVVVWGVQSMVQILTTLGELEKVHWGRVGGWDQIGSGVDLLVCTQEGTKQPWKPFGSA